MYRYRDAILLFLKGASMGAADLVPGVSGGSIALITGIYEKLLNSLKSFDKTVVQLLFKLEFQEIWKHIDGKFLVTLFAGILTSVFALSKFLSFLITHYPIPLWSFFSGLIIIAALIILRDIKSWSWGVIIALAIGTLAAYIITGLPPTSSTDAVWFVFISGAIAISAMILPGISGSFILLILGQYERILLAVNERDIFTLALFALGCVVGLLSFSRLISWLLKQYHNFTIALLSGFMIGSINKLWPWKQVISYRLDSKGVQQPFLTENILPHRYLEITGEESLILFAALAFSFGVFLVLGIDRTAYYFNRK